MHFAFVVSGGLGYHIPNLFENESSFTEFEKALKLLREQGYSGVELNLSLDNRQVLSRIRNAVHEEGFGWPRLGQV